MSKAGLSKEGRSREEAMAEWLELALGGLVANGAVSMEELQQMTMKEIERKRKDPVFMARLQDSLERNRAVVEQLGKR